MSGLVTTLQLFVMSILHILLTFIPAGCIAFTSFRLRLLTATGSLAQFFLAVIVYGFGEWQFTLPILSFFLLSSLVSKLSNRYEAFASHCFDKGSARDFWQVMANGGIPAAIVIAWWLTGLEILYIGFLSGVSVAAADTWATEIGTLSQRKPRIITTFETAPAGSSGAVTLIGFLGAIGGSLSIIAFSSPWLSNNDFRQIALIVVTAGLAGAIVDSLAVQQFRVNTNARNVAGRRNVCLVVAVQQRGQRAGFG